MFVSHLAAGGLLLSLLALSLDGKPAPGRKASTEGSTALGGRELTRLSGPAAGGGRGGSKAGNVVPTQPKSKGSSAASTSRLMRDLRPESSSSRRKATRPVWRRMTHPEQQAGGGGRQAHRPKTQPNNNGCFGVKIDRIGAMSGLGC